MMSCDYASKLSNYRNKGVCGIAEVKLILLKLFIKYNCSVKDKNTPPCNQETVEYYLYVYKT